MPATKQRAPIEAVKAAVSVVDTAVNLECDFESLPFSLGPRLDQISARCPE